jgi:hypothetical protein
LLRQLLQSLGVIHEGYTLLPRQLHVEHRTRRGFTAVANAVEHAPSSDNPSHLDNDVPWRSIRPRLCPRVGRIGPDNDALAKVAVCKPDLTTQRTTAGGCRLGLMLLATSRTCIHFHSLLRLPSACSRTCFSTAHVPLEMFTMERTDEPRMPVPSYRRSPCHIRPWVNAIVSCGYFLTILNAVGTSAE